MGSKAMSLLKQNILSVLAKFVVVCALVLASQMATKSHAQSPYSAAYRVNSAVITHYEISQMQLLLEALGRGGDNLPQTALDVLINDRLLRQEAKRVGIEIDPVVVSRALETLTDNPDKLRADLNKRGISNETIDSYMESQVLLNTYLDIRGLDIQVSPDEIVSRIMQIPDQVTPVVYVAEIVMPYAEYGGRLPTRLKLTEVMDDLRSGRKSFQSLAREVSRSPTASKGGVIGPIPREALNGQLASMVKTLRPGQVAAPIETEGAIVILQYVGPSEIRNSLPRSLTVTYAELFVAANGNLPASKQGAVQIQHQAPNCKQAQALSPASYHENVAISSLSSGLSLALARLESGESAIFEREDGTSVLYLCSRAVVVPQDMQSGVQGFAQSQAMEERARGAMQELRNLAIIEAVK